MSAKIVRGDRTGGTINDDDHVIRQELAIMAKSEPRRTSLPAAALQARGQHMIERRSSLG